jgi:hypothetical protein
VKHTVLRVPLKSDDYEIKVMLAGHVIDREHIVIDTREMRGGWSPLLPSEFRYNLEEGDLGEGFGDRCLCCGRLVAAVGSDQVVAGSETDSGSLPESYVPTLQSDWEEVVTHLAGWLKQTLRTNVELKAMLTELRAELQRAEGADRVR